MRTYIAGPMTGLPNFNFASFFAAQERLVRRGHTVINPARHDEEMGWVTVTRDSVGGILSAVKVPGAFDWGTALAWDIEQLTTCDAIYLLPGWSRSRGACKEYAFAKEHGLRILGATGEDVAPSKSQPLVGLVGYAQSGKDSLALYLRDHGYLRYAFADPLKELALECNPRVGDYDQEGGSFDLHPFVNKWGWEPAKSGVHGVREFLQNLGVGVRKVLGPDTWVNAAFAGYDPSRPAVFTDVRFRNEIAAIRDRGGVIVRINRPGVGPVNQHVSEFEWQESTPDYTIANDGTLMDLRFQAQSLDSELRLWRNT